MASHRTANHMCDVMKKLEITKSDLIRIAINKYCEQELKNYSIPNKQLVREIKALKNENQNLNDSLNKLRAVLKVS